MSKRCLAELSCNAPCNDSDNITQKRWSTLKIHLEKWRGLDTFGELYESIDWNTGPSGYYIHKICSFKIESSRYLEQEKTTNKSKF